MGNSLSNIQQVPLELNNKHYIVYSDGRIFSKQKNKYLAQHSNGNGYLGVGIGNKRFYVHRLVAQAFIPNPSELPDVNHLDGIKTNNYETNLEWCSRLDNLRHAHDTGLFDTQRNLEADRRELWVGLKNTTRTILKTTNIKNKVGNYKVVVQCNCGNTLEMYFNDFQKDKQSYCRKCRPKSSYTAKFQGI